MLRLLSLAFLIAMPVSALAAEPIEYDGKKLPDWLKQLANFDKEKHNDALKALKEIVKQDRDAVRPIVDEFLKLPFDEIKLDYAPFEAYGPLLYQVGHPVAEALHPHLWGDNRDRALKALLGIALIGSRGNPAAPGVIELAERTRDDKLFRGAMLVMFRSKERIYLPALLRLLDAEDERKAELVLDVLQRAEYPAESYLPVLKRWLATDRRDLALAGLRDMGRSAAPVATELIKMLPKADRDAQLLILQILANVGEAARPAAVRLAAFTEGDDAGLAAAAVFVLANFGNLDNARTSFAAFLKDKQISFGAQMRSALELWKVERSPAVVPFIAERLKKADAETTELLIKLAGNLGPSAAELVSTLIELLDSKEPVIRLEAARALGNMGPAAVEANAALKKLLDDKIEVIGIRAAVSLSRIAPSEVSVSFFIKKLASPNENIRAKALSELAHLGALAKQALPEIRKCLDDSDAVNRIRAWEALWLIEQDPKVLPALIDALRDANADCAAAAAAAIGVDFGAKAADAYPALIVAMWTSDVQSNAAEALGRCGPNAKKAIPALIRLLKTDGLDKRSYSSACEALGLMGADAKSAMPALEALLTHDDPLTRIHAALALLRIDDNRKGLPVIDVARHSNSYAAYIGALEADWLLKKEPATIKALIEELRTANLSDHEMASNRVFMAFRALGRCGPMAKDALPDLRDLLYNDDPVLCREVAQAIKLIEAK